jgi:agmatinase
MLRKTNLIWENLYSLKEADIVLLGVPFDSTVTEIPGTRFAPNRIREDFQVHVDGFDPQLGDLEEVKLHDAGNVEVLHGNIDKTNEDIYEAVLSIKEENPDAILITLGGEHSITYPIVKALYEKDFSYLCYDAHTDLYDEYNGLKNSHACVNRRVYDLLGNVQVNGYNPTKDDQEAVKKLKKVNDPIYLSIDVDVFSDKVGCPASSLYDFEKMWGEIKNRDIVAADVVEYNPLVGKDIRVAELVKRLILKCRS